VNPLHVIKRPLLTEKSTYAANEHNRHAFVVSTSARKDEIKAAVQELYGVRVLSVSTVNCKDRIRRYRYGTVPAKTTKKAIVKVHPDDKIELL
jgi:large subunit ribosomal protein L23